MPKSKYKYYRVIYILYSKETIKYLFGRELISFINDLNVDYFSVTEITENEFIEKF